MDESLAALLAEQGRKIDAIYVSVEKTRKYFFWTLVATVAFFVLPLIGLAFAIPFFLNSYLGAMGNL